MPLFNPSPGWSLVQSQLAAAGNNGYAFTVLSTYNDIYIGLTSSDGTTTLVYSGNTNNAPALTVSGDGTNYGGNIVIPYDQRIVGIYLPSVKAFSGLGFVAYNANAYTIGNSNNLTNVATPVAGMRYSTNGVRGLMNVRLSSLNWNVNTLIEFWAR